MNKPELIYFPCFGRGGLARLMFQLADIDFEDTRVPWEDWKDTKEKMPLGALPVLRIDGQTFCQMKAINKFLANKAGLLGQTDIEHLQVDMLVETRQEFSDKSVAHAKSKAVPLASREQYFSMMFFKHFCHLGLYKF